MNKTKTKTKAGSRPKIKRKTELSQKNNEGSYLLKVTQISKSKYRDELYQALQTEGVSRNSDFRKTMLFRFLTGIFFEDSDGLKVKSIVEENSYLSLSYAGDYRNYYSHCFRHYPKLCKRVHFFKKDYNEQSFLELLHKGASASRELQANYLGHIVVKPIPDGYIGASLLMPYYQPKKNRYYTAVQEYPVNMFGYDIRICTMPFFEQDQIIASCATSALWFAFHRTRNLFLSKVPDPSEITLSAGSNSYNSEMSFPSRGLEIHQINNAIKANGMLPAFINVPAYLQSSDWLRSFIYAFSRMGVPVLIGLDIDGEEEHLITINGYRFKQQIKSSREKKRKNKVTEFKNDNTRFDVLRSIKLRSHGIEKFYAHDDQVGPFARLEILDDDERDYKRTVATHTGDWHLYSQFRTSWWKDGKSKEVLQGFATAVFVPLKKEIRLEFQTVFAETAYLNMAMTEYMRDFIDIDLHWDVYLQEKALYKKELRQLINKGKCDSCGEGLLYQAIPEFIWVVRCYIYIKGAEFPVFDILYDAADLDIQNNIFYTNFLNTGFRSLLENLDMLKGKEGDQRISFDMLEKLKN